MTNEVQEPVYDGLFGGESCKLPERFKSSKLEFPTKLLYYFKRY
jgi:hypothetical protein